MYAARTAPNARIPILAISDDLSGGGGGIIVSLLDSLAIFLTWQLNNLGTVEVRCIIVRIIRFDIADSVSLETSTSDAKVVTYCSL